MALETHHAAPLIPASEFDRIRRVPDRASEKVLAIGDMCRWNLLSAIVRAGSGHMGSSLSAVDLMSFLLFEGLDTLDKDPADPSRDVFFSSKGHDVPAFYAVLHAAGRLAPELMERLRRIAGLPGHPDVRTGLAEATTTGSLGMGLSKGKGLAIAKRIRRDTGRVVVLCGDGELQEGQIYEAMQTAAMERLGALHLVVDHNKVQSDRPVAEIGLYDRLDERFRSFGWHVARCNGHDPDAIRHVWRIFASIDDRPKVLIADTIKGRGVSFMEHPRALTANGGTYRWHAGAPDTAAYVAACEELAQRIGERARACGVEPPALAVPRLPRPAGRRPAPPRDHVGEAFGEALCRLGESRSDLVVLDADLAADGWVRAFEERFPDRFVECGIAEQDMVSTAGGLARGGLLPVVSSFAAFLASRANEQAYNADTEGAHIVYACHYAGLLPAGPGLTHQSLRDISLFSALPGVCVVQPVNAAETRQLLDHCVNHVTGTAVMRLQLGPSPEAIVLPEGYRAAPGRGVALTDGDDAVLMAYGPVMVREALAASRALAAKGTGVKVINMPWLTQVDPDWLLDATADAETVYVIDDHVPTGGLGDRVLDAYEAAGTTSRPAVVKLGVEGHPMWGTAEEVLAHHHFDGASLARRIATDLAAARGAA